MLTDVDGVAVGHWTNPDARTGCTVVVLPEGSVASGEIRGGAPATREFGLLDPMRTVAAVDAVVLSGGSAFGLAAADGVVEGLAGLGRGFATTAGSVPIVVAMSLYDLAQGDPSVRPGAREGRSAFDAAAAGGAAVDLGPVGAGAGATVDKWSGDPKPGGLGGATVRAHDHPDTPVGPDVVVSAMVAVNAFGAIDDGTARDPGPPSAALFGPTASDESPEVAGNTTIGCIVTNARLDKAACHQLAQAGHDGLARALRPAHTPVDGDALVAASTGEIEVQGLAALMYLRLLAEQAVTSATRSLA